MGFSLLHTLKRIPRIGVPRATASSVGMLLMPRLPGLSIGLTRRREDGLFRDIDGDSHGFQLFSQLRFITTSVRVE